MIGARVEGLDVMIFPLPLDLAESIFSVAWADRPVFPDGRLFKGSLLRKLIGSFPCSCSRRALQAGYVLDPESLVRPLLEFIASPQMMPSGRKTFEMIRYRVSPRRVGDVGACCHHFTVGPDHFDC